MAVRARMAVVAGKHNGRLFLPVAALEAAERRMYEAH